MSGLPTPTEAPTPQPPLITTTPTPQDDVISPRSRAVTPSPSTAGSEKATDDTSKLRTLVGILKKFIGVADIANVRFSLPAQLLEPVPNLEYWHYLDRPDAFCAIGDSDDPLGRLLQCLRFWFTKDLKFIRCKPVKPYNSTLGEFFRCQWQVDDINPALLGNDTKRQNSTASAGTSAAKVKVNYLTEQTSHHPPVSAYYVDCPDKGISACGYDQISAKFTGTNIRVTAGTFNQGIFITLHKWNNEEYHMTHPTAFLGGFLRGSLNITVADTCVLECPANGFKVLMHYLEEGWLGKTQNRLQGIVYRCNVATDKTSRLKDVPEKDMVGRIEGAWHDKIYFSPGSTAFDKAPDNAKLLLIDNTSLLPVPKAVPPMDAQLSNESRRFWDPVTDAIVNRDFSRATSAKQEIEERQRQKAADRAARDVEWRPRFFESATDPSGRPTLTAEGAKVIKGLQNGDFGLEESGETSA